MTTHTTFSVPSRRSHRARLTSVALVAALSALAACGGGGSDGPTSPTPGGGGGGSGGGNTTLATLTVTNQSPNNTASFVRTRSCGAGSWGPDLLGTGILGKGESVSTTLAAGCYDVRVTPSEYGVTYLYFNGVQVASGENKVLTITGFPAE